jgi:hypothetical protein
MIAMKYLYLPLIFSLLPIVSISQLTDKQKATVDRHIDVVYRADSTFDLSSTIQVVYKNGEQTLTKDWVELRLMRLGFNLVEDGISSDVAVIDEETNYTDDHVKSKSKIYTENSRPAADYKLSLRFSTVNSSVYKYYDYLSLRLTQLKTNRLVYVGTFAPEFAFYWKRKDVLDRMFQHFESAFGFGANKE